MEQRNVTKLEDQCKNLPQWINMKKVNNNNAKRKTDWWCEKVCGGEEVQCDRGKPEIELEASNHPELWVMR